MMCVRCLARSSHGFSSLHYSGHRISEAQNEVLGSRSDAEEGAVALVPLKIPSARINVLTPEVADKEIAGAPAMASEQPGMGEAMGAVVGGAMGVAGGVGFAPAVASLLVPGEVLCWYRNPSRHVVGRDWGCGRRRGWCSTGKCNI